MEIEGFTDYLIYPDGRLWSNKSNRFLKHTRKNTGYMCVNLDKKQKYIHRLIASHYISNPNNYPQVDHINRDRQDNRIQNLRWVDQSLQETNKIKGKNNISGHTGICYEKTVKWKQTKRWLYVHKSHRKRFITKKEALCYKFIRVLMTAVADKRINHGRIINHRHC